MDGILDYAISQEEQAAKFYTELAEERFEIEYDDYVFGNG